MDDDDDEREKSRTFDECNEGKWTTRRDVAARSLQYVGQTIIIVQRFLVYYTACN